MKGITSSGNQNNYAKRKYNKISFLNGRFFSKQRIIRTEIKDYILVLDINV